jgi:prephenate dehydratase
MNVGYLGPPGSYSHQAVLQLFRDSRPQVEYTALDTIPHLFAAIKENTVDASVVPFENSTNGRVPATEQAVESYYAHGQLLIYAETKVQVNHCIARRRIQDSAASDQQDHSGLSGIKSLHSHSQVWGQCSTFLNKEFNDYTLVKRIDEGSTSQAAEIVSKDESFTQASISSVLAAQIYNLQILVENIQDDASNVTRFLLVTNAVTELAPEPASLDERVGFPLDAREYLELDRK